MDSPFGVYVHNPRFLEWVGAPKSAHLLSRPPAEWLQVMNRWDTLHAVLQLQRDASLMSSNLTVLHQDAIALHRVSTELLNSMFGLEFFPSGAVNDAAPVPLQCFGCRPIWQLWAFGDRRLARVVMVCTPGRGVPGLSHVSSMAIQLVVGAGQAGLPPCTGLFWNLLLYTLNYVAYILVIGHPVGLHFGETTGLVWYLL